MHTHIRPLPDLPTFATAWAITCEYEHKQRESKRVSGKESGVIHNCCCNKSGREMHNKLKNMRAIFIARADTHTHTAHTRTHSLTHTLYEYNE